MLALLSTKVAKKTVENATGTRKEEGEGLFSLPGNSEHDMSCLKYGDLFDDYRKRERRGYANNGPTKNVLVHT